MGVIQETNWYRIHDTGLVEFPLWENVKMSQKKWEFFNDPHPRKLLIAGRGYGKTHDVVFEKAIKGFQFYWERKLSGKHVRSGIVWHLIIFAGTEANLLGNWEKLVDFIPRIPGKAPDGTPNYLKRENDKTITLFGQNQFQISLMSCHKPDTIRGPGADDSFVDEALAIKKSTFWANIVPMVFRPGYDGMMTIASTPDEPKENKDPFFDAACEEADTNCDKQGYFSDWKLYTGTTFDNPLLTDKQFEQILLEKQVNPYRFRRDRLGERGVLIPSDIAPDCPVTEGMLTTAWTTTKYTIPPQPLVVWDLGYGGKDEIVRMVWDKANYALLKLDIWTSAELGITLETAKPSWSKIFEKTAREFPGCTQVYDATGPNGAGIHVHVPGFIRTVPVVRNNTVKNKHVSDLIERLVNVNESGQSLGLRLPDPDKFDFASEKQRENIIKLKNQVLHYRMVTEQSKGMTKIYYTCGEFYRDDVMDCLTISCAYLPPMRKGGSAGAARQNVFNRR